MHLRSDKTGEEKRYFVNDIEVSRDVYLMAAVSEQASLSPTFTCPHKGDSGNCTGNWYELSETDLDDVRQCPNASCGAKIHLAKNSKEVAFLEQLGVCVAYDDGRPKPTS